MRGGGGKRGRNEWRREGEGEEGETRGDDDRLSLQFDRHGVDTPLS